MADANNLHNYIKGLKKNVKVNKKEGEEKESIREHDEKRKCFNIQHQNFTLES